MFQTTNQYIYCIWYGMILWDKNDNFSGNILAHIFLLQSCNDTLAMRNRRAQWIAGGYPLDDIGMIWLAVSHMLHGAGILWYIYLQNWVILFGQMLGFIYQHHGSHVGMLGIMTRILEWKIVWWMMDEDDEDDDDDDVISWARYPPRIDASWLSFQSVGQSSRHEPHFHARSGGLCPNVGA